MAAMTNVVLSIVLMGCVRFCCLFWRASGRMFRSCVCGSAILPLPLPLPPSLSPVILLIDVSAAALDVSSVLIDVSSPQFPLDPSSFLQDVSGSEESVIDLSGTVSVDLSGTVSVDLSGSAVESETEKIDQILHETPEDPVENAIAKLWIPQRDTNGAGLGPPLSRATLRG